MRRGRVYADQLLARTRAHNPAKYERVLQLMDTNRRAGRIRNDREGAELTWFLLVNNDEYNAEVYAPGYKFTDPHYPDWPGHDLC